MCNIPVVLWLLEVSNQANEHVFGGVGGNCSTEKNRQIRIFKTYVFCLITKVGLRGAMALPQRKCTCTCMSVCV